MSEEACVVLETSETKVALPRRRKRRVVNLFRPEFRSIQDLSQDSLASLGYDLSPREIELLRELLTGDDTSTISEHLGLAVATTATYAKRIYAKLRVNGRAETMHLFHGLINSVTSNARLVAQLSSALKKIKELKEENKRLRKLIGKPPRQG